MKLFLKVNNGNFKSNYIYIFFRYTTSSHYLLEVVVELKKARDNSLLSSSLAFNINGKRDKDNTTTYKYDLMGNRIAVIKTNESGTIVESEKSIYNESNQVSDESEGIDGIENLELHFVGEICLRE